DLLELDRLAALEDEEPLHEILQLAHVPRPRIITQPVLSGYAESAQRQPLRIDECVDVIAEKLGHVFRILAQRRDMSDHDRQVRQQLAAEVLAALEPGRRTREN